MRRFVPPALIALFAASGFAGLIYESIWTHYLKLFLGHAAYAQTLVLAIFMGGLALGSFIAARFTGRWNKLLRGYALTEAAIGVLALVFREVFAAATGWAYASSLLRFAVFKWSLAGLLILPQCVLLGMTFPLMTAGILRAFPERPGRSLSLLYFTNSLGAAAGVLVSGFVLVRLVGLPGTVRTAGVINLIVAAAVWLLASGPAPAPAAAATGGLGGRVFWIFLGVAFVTGASSFVYEARPSRSRSAVHSRARAAPLEGGDTQHAGSGGAPGGNPRLLAGVHPQLRRPRELRLPPCPRPGRRPGAVPRFQRRGGALLRA